MWKTKQNKTTPKCDFLGVTFFLYTNRCRSHSRRHVQEGVLVVNPSQPAGASVILGNRNVPVERYE